MDYVGATYVLLQTCFTLHSLQVPTQAFFTGIWPFINLYSIMTIIFLDSHITHTLQKKVSDFPVQAGINQTLLAAWTVKSLTFFYSAQKFAKHWHAICIDSFYFRLISPKIWSVRTQGRPDTGTRWLSTTEDSYRMVSAGTLHTCKWTPYWGLGPQSTQSSNRCFLVYIQSWG